MQKVFENLIGRLEKLSKEYYKDYNTYRSERDLGNVDGLEHAIEIVNQLAEEYINCSTDSSTNNESVKGDLISRSATINALEEGVFVPAWNLALAQTIVSKQPTAYNDGWISVKDRLPDEGGYYLVVYHDWSDGNYLPKYDDVRVKVMHYQVKDLATGYNVWNYPRTIGENADLIEADQHREVTHWKPLPSLPYQPKGE